MIDSNIVFLLSEIYGDGDDNTALSALNVYKTANDAMRAAMLLPPRGDIDLSSPIMSKENGYTYVGKAIDLDNNTRYNHSGGYLISSYEVHGSVL